MTRLILIPCLLTLAACTLPFGMPGAPAAPAAPPTQVGVALPPAWTPTPETTQPPTARPPTQAAAAPTTTPEFKVTALRLSEISGGYAPVQPITYGLSPAILAAGVLQPQAIAMFGRSDNGTLVISVAAALTTATEEQGFATWIETPTILIEALAGVIGRLEGPTSVLDGYSDLGTASAAAEGTILMGETRYTTQVVLVRQGQAAAYVAALTPRYADLGFDLNGVMRIYAQRLAAEAGDASAAPVP
jgi:hypothetical protein